MSETGSAFTFSCVTENRADWFRKVRNLVVSIRSLDDPRRTAPIVVSVVGRPDRQIWAPLDRWNVDLRAVEPFDVRFPHANKLRMFEHPDVLKSADVLVALDCDIIVARDPLELMSTSAIRAKPEDQTILEDHHWLTIYEAMGITPPEKNCVMTSSGQLSYPWWNSGVVGVPTRYAAELHEQWSDNISIVASLHDRGALPANWITDQIGFVCALLQRGLPFEPMPITGNYPTCFPIHPDVRAKQNGQAVFIHYHHHVTVEGFLRSSGDAALNEQLDRFNATLAHETGLAYESLSSADVPPTRMERVRTSLQRRLKHYRWYKSPRLRPVKAALSNAADQVRQRMRRMTK